MKRRIVELLGLAAIVGLSACSIPGTGADPSDKPSVSPIVIEETDEPDVIETDEPDVTETDEPEIDETDEPEIQPDSVDNANELSNVEDQLALIEDSFDTIYEELNDGYFSFEYSGMYAITDMNRNGRLELLITDCQGTGAFSYSAMYEVSEDYSTLERVSSEDEEFGIDMTGDFVCYNDFECYEKDGKYYYIVEDYCSAGWDYKGSYFYSYNFDDCMSYEDIGGFLLYGEGMAEENLRHVNLWDSDGTCFENEDDYFAYMKDYWNGYEKQPSVHVSWQRFDNKENFGETLQTSYEEFDTNAGDKETEFGFKYIFGDDMEYIIEID